MTKLGLGQLPGDIRITRDNFLLYAPLASGLVPMIAGPEGAPSSGGAAEGYQCTS
ncbi:DUF2905 domain-containing protein [Methylocystis sp.]|uniref:DUF2905 domain-containing protein n=1 Tax=Methylocystis sp. TaxID=1911079 RepID=UPI00345BF573